MNGQLSNGLAPLTTAGNRIVHAVTGEPVLLRGVNRSGLEYAGPDEQGFLSGASLSRAEIEFIVREWRCNILRLPFNQDFVLRGRLGRSGEEYQQALDQVIYWASLFGAYTLLDLQWLDADRIYGGHRNFVAPLPNSDSLTLWSTLARRYKDEPAVLYDLFNEPHDRLIDDPFPLHKQDGTTYPPTQRAVTMKEWQPWARALAAAVRNENPDALLFIGGTNWAYDLRGMPMDLDNIVYSTHVYPGKGDRWPEIFGHLSQSVPVFVGEFGGSESSRDLHFLRKLLRYLDELELGWTAWSWSNQPFLVTRYLPTAYGEAVRQILTRP
ncbi:MAG TPA: cellulase family glycosylhydrolase [Terracidiphilus sp.]|jgi:endoglucanase|nr:cellulase family glycosylhydrolase [Terracidiphilus sp.]